MSKSKPKDSDDAPKKGGAMKIILGGVALLAAGAGGTYGAFAAGLIGGGAEESGPDLPKLVSKGEDDPYAPPPADGAGKDAAPEAYGEGGSEYRTIYYSFEESFTSNLKDSAGLVQLSLAASTRHDGRVIQWLQRHELAIRSAILVELANTPEEDVFDAKGKARMQTRLADSINAVLIEQEGFGGVDAVHFRTFLIQ